MTTEEIISLSDQRLKELRTGFDPNTGEGSLINRFPIRLTPEGKEIHLPVSLQNEYGSLGKESLQDSCSQKDFHKEVDRLIAMRLSTDFEYWAAKCAWITDKESENIIPFSLNIAQRKALRVIYGMIERDEPIRLNVLKSRQNGFSTLKQIIDAWIQLEVKENWHNTIVAQLDDQTRTIRSMYSRLLKHYPLGSYTYTSHEGSTKNKIIKERGCIQSIGSYEMPDSLRSRDIRLVHYCLHPETPIISNDGFIKPIKDVKIGDRVVTHNGAITSVKNIVSKKPDKENGNGKALKVTPWLGDQITLTPNHEVYTNHGWKRADELSNYTWLSMPIRPITNTIKEFILPETLGRRHGGGTKGAGGGKKIRFNYDFGYTVGYYLAEGSVHIKKNEDGLITLFKEMSFARHDDEVEFGNQALKGIEGLYSSHNRNNVKNCLTTREEIHGSILSEFFHCNFGSKEHKTIPDWVFNAGKDFLKGLLTGYLHGDGSKTDYFSNNNKYETALITSKSISSSIATQIRDIALSLKLGWGSIKYKPAGNYHGRNCKESWTTTWTGLSAKNIFKLIGRRVPENGFDKAEKSRIVDDKIYFKIKKIEPTTVDYVYDIEVNHSDHSFRTLYFSVSNSEVGLWKETKNKSPKSIVASVSSAVPSIPWTFIAYESTAAGVANFFHKQWIASEKGTGFPGIFIPWFENVFDLTDFKSEEDKVSLAESLNEYEIEMFNLGATLEGINWYRNKLKDLGDADLLKQESPCTPEEAFQSTGRPAFKVEYINNLKTTIRDPAFIGEIESDAQSGPNAFENIEFLEKEKGRFKIWNKPNDPPVDEGMVFKGTRYVVTLDIGGVSKGSDYSSISVLDRYWLAGAPGDGKVEKVAQWHGHLDPDLMAWLAAIVASYYEDGVLVIENNTYDSRYQKTDGDHSYTVLDEIGGFYTNLYSSTPIDLIKQGVPKKYGFRTDVNTKPMIVNFYRQLLRSKSIIERNIDALQEAKNYEITEQGKFSAVPGNHDDILMSDMIGYWVACSDKSPLGIPSIEKEEVIRKRLDKENVRSHASF